MNPGRFRRGAAVFVVLAVAVVVAATACGRGGGTAKSGGKGAGPARGAGGHPAADRPAQAAKGNAAAKGKAGQAVRPPSPTDLEGAWLLEDLGGRGVVDMVQSTLEFTADGRLSGSGGCNRFTGTYTLDGDVLVVGPLAATRMMCPETVMAQEDGLFQALGAVDRVAVSGPFLLIHCEGSEQPLKFTRMEPDVID